MRTSSRQALALPPILFLTAALLLCGAAVSDAAYRAMELSAKTLVPSLFPFSVLAFFLVQSGLGVQWSRPLAWLVERLFHLEGGCAPAWLLGMVCGFPVGAATAVRLCEQGAISRDSAARALPLCTNAGPVFLIAVAGRAVLGSEQAGWLLLAVHLTASLLAGILLRGDRMPPSRPPVRQDVLPLTAVFTEAVKSAALTMIQVSGFVVLASVLLCLLRLALSAVGLPQALLPLSGVLELTNGLTLLRDVELGLRLRFIVASAMLGWSGLCVHAQVLSLSLPLGLPAVPYLKGKLFHSLLATLLSIPASLLLEDAVQPVFASFIPATFGSFCLTSLWAIGILPLFFRCLWKSGPSFGIIEQTRREADGMLFRESEFRCCANCACAAETDEDRMLCRKRGLVSKDGHCSGFRYDPLKREPSRPLPGAAAPEDADFSL